MKGGGCRGLGRSVRIALCRESRLQVIEGLRDLESIAAERSHLDAVEVSVALESHTETNVPLVAGRSDSNADHTSLR